MSKTFNPDDELEIRGRMDIEDIVKYQINRCNVSSSDPNPKIFNSNVMVLLDLLPAHKREQLLSKKQEYGKYQDREVFDQVWGGIPIPSSRRTINEFVIDYHLLFRMVLDAFADSGLTWKIEQELIELGKVGSKKIVPTPYFGEQKNEQNTKGKS